jgi:hypothetical protein
MTRRLNNTRFTFGGPYRNRRLSAIPRPYLETSLSWKLGAVLAAAVRAELNARDDTPTLAPVEPTTRREPRREHRLAWRRP